MLNILNRDFDIKSVETLIVPVIKDIDLYEQDQINEIVRSAYDLIDFPAEAGEQLILHNVAGLKNVILLGLGKPEKLKVDDLRVVAGSAVKNAMKLKMASLYLAIPAKLSMDYLTVFEAMCEGVTLRNHIFDRYKKEKKDKVLETISLYTHWEIVDQLVGIADRVSIIALGTCAARDWVTTPANDMTPAIFADQIVAGCYGTTVKIDVMDEAKLTELGFGALLAVAVGSKNKPRFVVMEYDPGNTSRTVALIGKAVTFDSGGLNLKPGESMSDMKCDMSGGAAVAATMLTAAKLNLPVRLIGAIPMVENMPSGHAIRPGDIVKSYSGKTIEILNTDAEGRLILVDALCYIKDTYKPDVMIDLATLTGACVVALGEKIAGLFSPDDELADKLFQSGTKTNERCWRLPLPDDYKKDLKSDLADMKNISQKRWGGAISAALFLLEFVDMDKWAHIDIAGPAHSTKPSAYCPVGGTGFGVRLLIDYLTQ